MHVKRKVLSYLLAAAMGAAAIPAALVGSTPAMAAGTANITLQVEDLMGNPITTVLPNDPFQVRVSIDVGASQSYAAQYALAWTPGLVSYDEPATSGGFYYDWAAAHSSPPAAIISGYADAEQADGLGPLNAHSLYGFTKPAGPTSSGLLGVHKFTAGATEGTVSFNFNTLGEIAVYDGNTEPMDVVAGQAQLMISQPKPDLVVSDKFERWVDYAAGQYEVVATVTNLGSADAGPSQTLFSIDGSRDSDTKPTPSIPQGQSVQVVSKLFTMDDASDIILVIADATLQVPETNDQNNTRENIFPRVQPYDLTVLKKSERWLNGYDDLGRPMFVVTFKVKNLGPGIAPAAFATVTTSDGQVAEVSVPQLAPGEITHLALETAEADAFSYTCGQPLTVTVAVSDNLVGAPNSLENLVETDCSDDQHIAAVVALGTLELEVAPFVNLDLKKGETLSKDMEAAITADMPWALMVKDIDVTGDGIAPDKKAPALMGHMVGSDGVALNHPLRLTYGLSMQDLTEGDIVLAEGIGPEIIDYNLVQKVEYTDTGGTYEIVIRFTLVPRY